MGAFIARRRAAYDKNSIQSSTFSKCQDYLPPILSHNWLSDRIIYHRAVGCNYGLYTSPIQTGRVNAEAQTSWLPSALSLYSGEIARHMSSRLDQYNLHPDLAVAVFQLISRTTVSDHLRSSQRPIAYLFELRDKAMGQRGQGQGRSNIAVDVASCSSDKYSISLDFGYNSLLLLGVVCLSSRPSF